MHQWIGFGIVLVDIIFLVSLYIYIHRKGTYKGDLMGLLLNSWEVIGLFIALLLLGCVLFFQ